jgi:hypothetical protein
VTDIDELNKVLDRAVGLRTFLTADDRIEKVAAFVAEHFREKVHPLGYKAFLVGVNREACAKYKRALDRLLPPEWSEAVYTDNAADVVDRPLVAAVQLSPEREADVRLLFKKPNENPKILIVTDKLLTGYDAPLLYCMYLDKPMRDHVLLQAIARVNRPYVDANGVQKRVGLVVDFVGVLRELKKALQFDSSRIFLAGSKRRRATFSTSRTRAAPTRSWRGWCMAAFLTLNRARRFLRPTRKSKPYGNSSRRRPNCATTSRRSSASRSSMLPCEMHMLTALATSPTLPTRRAAWSRRAQHRKV